MREPPPKPTTKGKLIAREIRVFLFFLVVAGCLVYSAFWAYNEYISTPPYIDNERYPVKGIDISRHNGNIDFKKVKEAGMDFVFIKASEGGDHRDSNFLDNYRNARAVGLKVGFYHFFRFDKEGVEQGVNFARCVGSRHSDLGLVIDIEQNTNPEDIPKEVVIDRLSSMVDYLNLLGFRVTFYSNVDGYYDYIAENFRGYPLWICSFHQYPLDADWTFWQYSHSGLIEGIEGKVDMNVFCGNRDEWDAYLKGGYLPYAN